MPNVDPTVILKMINQYPDIYRVENRNSIVSGVITIGMSPFEAGLAGGEFTYGVIADSKRWSVDVDPYEVMSAQSSEPDNSSISMTFTNTTQYPDGARHRFCAHIFGGRVVRIEDLGAISDE